MATIKIGDAAGNYDFSVQDFSLSMSGSYRSLALTTLKYGDNEHDYVELHGKFNYTSGSDAYDVVRSVTSLEVVTDDKTMLSISDLDIVRNDVKTKATLQDYFESQAYSITGNNKSNEISTADLADKIFGRGGNDVLSGNGGNDKLDGGDNNDKLDGGLGKDQLIGGTGNDTYIIDKYDTIAEAKKGGTDTISVEISVDLDKFDFIENLVLTGSKALNGSGDNADNVITGNGGANILVGDKGDDTLKGGAAADTFQFARGDDRDTILDFDASGRGQDHIDLSDFGVHLKFAKLDIEKSGRHDVDIDFGHGDHLILKGVSIKDIDASDFQF